jgi:predicted MFS family arabinose efflux permease
LLGWSWRLVFLINVPIGLAVIVYGLLTIRESARPNRSKLDPIGVILSSSVVLLLVYPIVEGRELGWPQWSICMLAASIPALVTLLLFESWLERKGGDPLIKLPLFQNLALSAGLMLSVTFYSSSGVFFIIVTVFLQQGAGYSALATGLMFLPFALGFCATSATSSRIGRRFGPWSLDLGAALMAVTLTGLALLALRYGRIDPTFMLAGFLIYGLGQGFGRGRPMPTVSGVITRAATLLDRGGVCRAANARLSIGQTCGGRRHREKRKCEQCRS